MGVVDFLPTVLPSAGTEVDLRKYRDGIDVMVQKQSPNNTNNKRQRVRRPLRIGVDIANWVARACHRFSPMLSDENHLTNYGRYTLHNNNGTNGTAQQQQPAGNGTTTTANDTTDKEKETSKKYITECTLYVLERLQSLQQETNAEILVVLDGATPPIKRPTVQKRSEGRKEQERVRDAPVVEMANNTQNHEERMEANLVERTKANRRAGAGKHFRKIVEELIYALRVNKIPFLVAPYEADGQLAWLSKERFIDMVITEDSDMVAQGGICMLYKIDFSIIQSPRAQQPENNGQGQQNKNGTTTTTAYGRVGNFSFVPKGTLLLRDNLGAVQVTKRNAKDEQKPLSLKDMSDAMLAVMFVAAGCDYCESLKGIGLVTACAIVQKAFLQQTEIAPLKLVFQQLFQHTFDKTIQKDKERQMVYKQAFLAALVMFRHPIVYNPFTQRCMVVNKEKGDPELIKYYRYQNVLKDDEALEEILGELIEDPMATFIAEGWVNAKTKQLYEFSKTAGTLPKAVKEHFGIEDPDSSDEAMSGENGNDKEHLDNSEEHKEDDAVKNSNIFDDAEDDDDDDNNANGVALGVDSHLDTQEANTGAAPPVDDDEDTAMEEDTQEANTGSTTTGPGTQEHVVLFGVGATVTNDAEDNTQDNAGSTTGSDTQEPNTQEPDTQEPEQNDTGTTARNSSKDGQNQGQTQATTRTESTTANSAIFDDAEGDDGMGIALRNEKPASSSGDRTSSDEEDGDTAQDPPGEMMGTQAETQETIDDSMRLGTQEPFDDSMRLETQEPIDDSMRLDTQEPINERLRTPAMNSSEDPPTQEDIQSPIDDGMFFDTQAY